MFICVWSRSKSSTRVSASLSAIARLPPGPSKVNSRNNADAATRLSIAAVTPGVPCGITGSAFVTALAAGRAGATGGGTGAGRGGCGA